MANLNQEPWDVMCDLDSGTYLFVPYLTKDHAQRLATLMNEIETERVERMGGSRARGDGHFYTAVKSEKKKDAATAAQKVMRDPKAGLSAKSAAASALTQRRRR